MPEKIFRSVRELFFEVCRRKTHIFIDTMESNKVYDLKKIIEGILKVSPDNQQLFKVKDGRFIGEILDDSSALLDSGFSSQTARAQQPALIGLALRGQGTAL
uniref:Uncharacterized protein n=1 Tax=Romanomermis culicivorax TaxID=13658 RepID=A0A915HI04_ROMCU